MDLFACVSAAKASFDIPSGLRTGKTADNVREWALCTDDTMMSRVSINEDISGEENEAQARVQDLMDDFAGRSFSMARQEDCV